MIDFDECKKRQKNKAFMLCETCDTRFRCWTSRDDDTIAGLTAVEMAARIHNLMELYDSEHKDNS